MDHSPITASPRLDEGKNLYDAVLQLADDLDQAELDLYAAGLRSCLDGDTTAQRKAHIAVELRRLASLPPVSEAGLDDVAVNILRSAGIGVEMPPVQPLYNAAKRLADHLELEGAQRWLGRLRTVTGNDQHSDETIIERTALLLDAMKPGERGVPPETEERCHAVAGRLKQCPPEETLTYLQFAFRRPHPSTLHDVGDEL